ncbi:hypothetical protein MUP56_02485 [Patescibacteria group bacterium]|nr:hypothetical protein [Patescibacteria group bacterium]
MENVLLLGLPLPAVVALLIELLKKVGMITTGDQARFANLVLSSLGALAVSLMSEFSVEVPKIVIVILAAVYSIAVSALGYSVGERIVDKL